MVDDSWEEEMIEKLRQNEEKKGYHSKNSFEENAIFRRVSSEVPQQFQGHWVKAICTSRRRSNLVRQPIIN